jgi:hypothetical protein
MNIVGYAPFAATNVQVAPDFTTTLNGQLRIDAVQMGETRSRRDAAAAQRTPPAPRASSARRKSPSCRRVAIATRPRSRPVS